MKPNKYLLIYVIAMIIYGTTPLVTHFINLPSSIIVLARVSFGLLFLLIYKLIIKREKFDFKAIKANLLPLLFCGIFLGLNWVTLFATYNLIDVTTSTLFNYIAPCLIFIFGIIVFKYKFSIKKMICLIISFVGLLFVMEIFSGGVSNMPFTTILIASVIPLSYALMVISNKFLKNISTIDRVIATLSFALITIVPFVFINIDYSLLQWDNIYILYFVIIGLIHTCIAYLLYFYSMSKLDTQNIAIFSYIEPVTAILLSIIFLHESLSLYTIIGAIMIIGSALISDIDFNKIFKRKTSQ